MPAPAQPAASAAPGQLVYEPGWSEVRAGLVGVNDGVQINHFVRYALNDSKIVKIYGACLVLNVVVLMGSVILLNRAKSVIGSIFTLSDTFETNADIIALLLWKLPLYLIGYPMNLLWGSEMFDRAYQTRGYRRVGGGMSYRLFLGSATDKAYYYLVIVAASVFSQLIVLVPWLLGAAVGAGKAGSAVGQVLAVMYDTWLYSFYVFDPRFCQVSSSFRMKVEYFEARWAYFLGYGLPATVLMLVVQAKLGLFCGQVLYFVLCPVHTLISVDVHPQKAGGPRLPLFAVPCRMVGLLLNR
eukprot:TRINITY_DN4548_c0_g3_i2.p1 TRINITY_DN4548_c0_g3~~TRINITY_DN4548_c0_g3_i2.p1  ORF type:complete len:298 (+),score=37.80 TRINITY_DN4548_c0_g3_i2:532-1425(+)